LKPGKKDDISQASYNGRSNRFGLLADTPANMECELGSDEQPNNLLMLGIKMLADISKVEARASLGGVMRLYAAGASTFRISSAGFGKSNTSFIATSRRRTDRIESVWCGTPTAYPRSCLKWSASCGVTKSMCYCSARHTARGQASLS